MPNGYGPAMRVFNKIPKVPLGYLRSPGHNCVDTISDTIKLLRELGFVINTESQC